MVVGAVDVGMIEGKPAERLVEDELGDELLLSMDEEVFWAQQEMTKEGWKARRELNDVQCRRGSVDCNDPCEYALDSRC